MYGRIAYDSTLDAYIIHLYQASIIEQIAYRYTPIYAGHDVYYPYIWDDFTR